MSEQVDQFCDKLRNRLNAIEERFRAVATDMQGFRPAFDRAAAAAWLQRGQGFQDETLDSLIHTASWVVGRSESVS